MKKHKSKIIDKKTDKNMSSKFDVNGAYTGTPAFDDNSAPVQDADDL
jgi:hypothetical protein